MANDLQTKHGRRLVHLYFVQWTEKTRQMQQAKDLHNRTVLKRFVTTKNCVFTATPLTYLDSNLVQRQNRQFSVRGDRITNELQMLAMRKASCCTTRFNCWITPLLNKLCVWFADHWQNGTNFQERKLMNGRKLILFETRQWIKRCVTTISEAPLSSWKKYNFALTPQELSKKSWNWLWVVNNFLANNS